MSAEELSSAAGGKVELRRLQEHVELSWRELQNLCKTDAQFNFGVPQLLVSELSLIETKIESAKTSRDPRRLESALSDTQTLLKRLRSLLNHAQNSQAQVSQAPVSQPVSN